MAENDSEDVVSAQGRGLLLRGCTLLVLALSLLVPSSCRSNGGGLPQAERLDHLAALEQESRLNENPPGGIDVASSRRVRCKDMDDSNRRLAVSRNYQFSGERTEVLDFHGSSLEQAGWSLTQTPDLGMDFTTAVYDKSFGTWQGRVVIIFNGQRIGLLAEDISSPVC